MIRAIIMCHGQQTRLPALAIKKHLLPLPLCNTTILGRTLRMLEAYDDLGEVVVIGPPEIAVTLGFTGALQGKMAPLELGQWISYSPAGEQVNAYADPGIVSTERHTTSGRTYYLRVATLGDKPGNSILRGLQKLRGLLAIPKHETIYGWDEPIDQTVVLLGDVVYSRACMDSLVKAVQQVWFTVSSDLSPSGGEVFGLSYSNIGTDDLLSLLDAVPHPPFEAYQPGQLRRLLWERQARWADTVKDLNDRVREVVRGQVRVAPTDACCTILPEDDFTKDIDTVQDLRRLGELDVAAWHDDQGVPFHRFPTPDQVVMASPPCEVNASGKDRISLRHVEGASVNAGRFIDPPEKGGVFVHDRERMGWVRVAPPPGRPAICEHNLPFPCAQCDEAIASKGTP